MKKAIFIKAALLLIGVIFFTHICRAAPVYGPDLPNRGKWYMGFEVNAVSGHYMKKGLGRAQAKQIFLDASYGIYDWMTFDGKLGYGGIEFDTRGAGYFDLRPGFAGGYGLRFRIYNNEEKRIRGVFGFQHISIHPPKNEVGNVKYSSIWDEWQLSLLVSKGIGVFEPYAGVKASQLYMIRKDSVREESSWNGARDHFGIFVGSKVGLTGGLYLDAEARFIDETAFSVAVIYKL